MSSNSITITAQLREITGTNKVRNLRKNEMVPAVIYGNEAEVQKVNIPLNELLKASQNDLFYTQILLIAIDGKAVFSMSRNGVGDAGSVPRILRPPSGPHP